MSFSGRFALFSFQPGAVLKIAGPDSQAFLQGQFTQELRSAQNNLAAYGLWLTQKGKVLADSFVLRESEVSWWVVSLSVSAALLRERLEAYLIADEVEIEDVTSGWQGFASWGEDAERRLSTWGALPAENTFSRPEGGLLFRGRRASTKSWEWLLPTDRVAEVSMRLGEAERPTEAEVERERIAAGIPMIPRDLGPTDLPHEGGLEESAISYTKGCYLGQEVMARLKSMGQVRRRLKRVRVSGLLPATFPADLWAQGKKVGELRSAASVAENNAIGLAMISLVGLGQAKAASFSAEGPTVVEIGADIHE